MVFRRLFDGKRFDAVRQLIDVAAVVCFFKQTKDKLLHSLPAYLIYFFKCNINLKYGLIFVIVT